MTTYELLLACFRSGQMSAAQMQSHMAADIDFANFVKNAVRSLENV